MDLIWIIIIGYAVLINFITLVMFGIDKSKAVGGRFRISEFTLFLFSFFGGVLGGALGMKLFRHKTRKSGFRVIMGLILLVNLAVYGWLAYHFYTGSGFELFNL